MTKESLEQAKKLETEINKKLFEIEVLGKIILASTTPLFIGGIGDFIEIPKEAKPTEIARKIQSLLIEKLADLRKQFEELK